MRTLTLAVVCSLVAGCHADHDAPTNTIDTTPSASASASMPNLPGLVRRDGGLHLHRAPSIHAPTIGCRAVSSNGTITFARDQDAKIDAGVVPLLPNMEMPIDVWMDLGDGAKVTGRDPRTTRETTFLGPAHVRPCVSGEEISYIARGSFMSAPNSGEAPGREEWVVTPFGVVRYAAASLRVVVAPAKVDVIVSGGSAQVWTLDKVKIATQKDGGAAVDGWSRVDGANSATMTLAGNAPTTDAVVAECKAACANAHAIVVKIAAPGASLSDLAPRHVAALTQSRAACEVARLRLAETPASPARASTLDAIDTALSGAKTVAP